MLISLSEWFSSYTLAVLGFILMMTAKSSLLILATFGLLKIARRTSSATRHFIWTLAFFCILLLPLMSLILPQWHINFSPGQFVASKNSLKTGVLPKNESSVLSNSGHILPGQKIISLATNHRAMNFNNGIHQSVVAVPLPEPNFINYLTRLWRLFLQEWPTVALSCWLIGTFIIYIRMLIGRIYIWRTLQKASEITKCSWLSLCTNLRIFTRIKRPVQLFKSSVIKTPMTWGFIHPKIMLPAEAETWSNRRRRYVLLHELAHIRRWDALTQFMAQTVYILFWFNPLIRIAYSRFLKEREFACDDFVLENGGKASSYANLLLDIAKSTPRSFTRSLATVAMARPSQLEGRLMAILDKHLNRRQLTRLALFCAIGGFILLILPLSSIYITHEQVGAMNLPSMVEKEIAKNKAPDSKTGIEIDSVLEKRSQVDTILILHSLKRALEDSSLGVQLQAIRSLGKIGGDGAIEALFTAMKSKYKKAREKAVDVLVKLDKSRPPASLATALKNRNWEIRNVAAWALGDIKDKAALTALSQVLNDDNSNVRISVIKALGEIKHKNAIEPLCGIFADKDWKIRRMAAWALGKIENHKALKALIWAINDENQQVRRAVIRAIGRIEHPDAIPSLSLALFDQDPVIRRKAAWALGEIEDPLALKTLFSALNDPDRNVRKNVAEALGDIRDQRALKPLCIALQDQDLEVRKEAANALGELDDKRALNPLIAALNDSCWQVRKEILEALGDIGDDRILQTVSDALNDNNKYVRREAAETLGKICE